MISVITPCLNSVAFIERCVENVAAQGCAEVEHIVMDGGSTDGTVEMLRTLAARHSHLRWVSEKDAGQSAAMNKGVAMAGGALVGFLNADDYYEPGTLLRVAGISRQLREPALLLGKCVTHDADGAVRYTYSPARAGFVEFLLGDFPSNPAAYFYHRSLHELTGPYDETDHYSMDYDFLLRAVRVARVHRYEEVWGHFVLHAGSKTAGETQAGRVGERLRAVAARHEKLLGPAERVRYRLALFFRRSPACRTAAMYLKNPRMIAGAVRQGIMRVLGVRR